ncbi:hypothetical protein QQX98_000336 [Neonectria punicea]|uniref:Uncharacterized protein n=1 Tax=Neonectria punicea TaxID=979145 RepID=A0ABR1HU67_9HYPO
MFLSQAGLTSTSTVPGQASPPLPRRSLERPHGIVPLVDPAMDGSDVENANSATSVQTPFDAKGLSQAEVDGAAAGGDAAAGDDDAAAGDNAAAPPLKCGGGNNAIPSNGIAFTSTGFLAATGS